MYNLLLIPSLAYLATAISTYIPPPSYILSSLSRPADGQISFKLTSSSGTYEIGALYAIGGAPCTGTYDPSTIPNTWQPCAETKSMKWRFASNSTDDLETMAVYVSEKDEFSPANYMPTITLNTGTFTLPSAKKSFTEQYEHIFGDRSTLAHKITPIKLSAMQVASAHSNPMSSDTPWCSSFLWFNMTDGNALLVGSGTVGSHSAVVSPARTLCKAYDNACSYSDVKEVKQAVCESGFGQQSKYSFDVVPIQGLDEFNLTLRESYSVVSDTNGTASGYNLLVTYARHVKGGVDLEDSPILFPWCKYLPCGYRSGNRTLEMPAVDVKVVWFRGED